MGRVTVRAIKELRYHWRRYGYKDGAWKYLNLPNVVTWFSIFAFAVILSLWINHLIKITVLADKLKASRSGNAGTHETWSDAERMDAIDFAEETIAEWHTFRTVVAFYPFVLMARLFKAFSAQPRLAIVTMTLNRAFVDVAHFGLVFVVIFMAFTVSAMILFGGEIEGFAELSRVKGLRLRRFWNSLSWQRRAKQKLAPQMINLARAYQNESR